MRRGRPGSGSEYGLGIALAAVVVLSGLGIALGPRGPPVTSPSIHRSVPSTARMSPSVSEGGGRPRPTASGIPATQYTLFLANNSLWKGDMTPPAPNDPYYTVYDPATGRVYASDGGGTLWVIDPSRMQVVGTIALGRAVGAMDLVGAGPTLALDSNSRVLLYDPEDNATGATIPVGNASAGSDATFVYDPTTNCVWVTNEFASYLNVVNLTTDSISSSLYVGGGFNDILSGAYDAENGRIYLVYYESGIVEVFDGRTASPVTNVSFGNGCCSGWGLVVDPVTGNVYVSQGGSVYEIWGSNDTAGRSASIGSHPSNGVYDPGTGDLLIADGCQDRLYAVRPSNLSVAATIFLPHQSAFLCDSWSPTDAVGLGQVYVGTGYDNGIMVADPTNETNASAIYLPSSPAEMVDDAACGCDAIADSQSDRLYLVDPVSLTVLRSVGLAGEPYGMAYDTATGDLWVTYSGIFGTNELQVLNGTNGSAVATLADSQGPWGVAYDPSHDQVFVADYWGNDVRVFNASNLTQTKVIPAGNQTTGVVYVPSDDTVYATDWGTHNLTVIDAATDNATGSIHIGGAPVPIGYDPAVNDLFVGNEANLNTSVVNVSQDNVTGSVPVNYTTDFAFDPSTGTAYLANETGSVWVVNATTFSVRSVPAGGSTESLLWSPEAGVLAGDGSTGAVYDIAVGLRNRTSNLALVAEPEQVATYAPLHLTLASLGAPANASYSFAGLPPGCTSENTSALLCYPQVPGTYDVTARLTSPHCPTWTVRAGVWVRSGYAAQFESSGLPSGRVWYLNVSGGQVPLAGNTTFLDLTLLNGSYEFVAGSPGYPSVRGSFSIDGSGVTTSVRFSGYPLYLEAMGLPSSDPWWATITGWGTVQESNAGGSTVHLPNGSYAIAFGTSVTGWSAPGQTARIDGSSETVQARFALPVEPVEFVASGLPAGTSWVLNVSGQPPVDTNGTTVERALPNGTYAYAASVELSGWNAPSGGFVVAGAAVAVAVVFSLAVFSQTFEADGLPDGAHWTVSLTPGNQTVSSQVPSMVLTTPGGTYEFEVSGPAGYRAGPSSGRFAALGDAPPILVEFVPVTAVAGPSVVSLSDLPDPVEVGTNLTISAGAVGGASPLTYAYGGLPPGCSSVNAPTLVCAPTAAGSGQIELTVTDAHGQSATRSAPYDVVPSGSLASSVASASPIPWTDLLIGSAVGLGAAFLAVWVLRPGRPGSSGGAPDPTGSPAMARPTRDPPPAEGTPTPPSEEPG